MGTKLAPLTLLLVAGLAVAAGTTTESGSLAAPVRVEAGDGPINVDVGHAAPFVIDWNRDGLPDLLVGQFGQGLLRIYVNVGTGEEPKFGKQEVFQAGGADGAVPAG